MITNDGKEIISKYLLGQVPTYATHLAIGCGATPLDANDSYPNNLYAKQQLDFEMTRVPISSKGFVDDSKTFTITTKGLVSNIATLTTSTTHDIVVGETVIVSGVDSIFNGQYIVSAITSNTFSFAKISTNVSPSVAVSPNGSVIVSRTKISLTAELPTDNRYEITEIGIWSAASNSLTSQYDSRMIFNFSQSWQIHDSSISDPPINTNLGYNGTTTSTDIQDTRKIFYANTSDALFQTNTRKIRKEGPRHLSRTLMARGDMSTISDGGVLNSNWVATGTHIHLNDINFDISGNNTADIMKLAFSVIDKTAIDDDDIKNVKILMEFYKTEVNTASGYAKAQIYVPGSYFIGGVSGRPVNRYYVADFEVSQQIDYSNESASYTYPYIKFYTSADFSAKDIRLCRIFVQILKNDNSQSTTHYLALDGFRIENTTQNPIYKMSGYSIIKNDGYPIIKLSNTNNYIDFRFGLGIG